MKKYLKSRATNSSLDLSKKIAEKLQLDFDKEEVRELTDNLHALYFNEIITKLELDLPDVSFHSGLSKEITAFAAPVGEKAADIFFDEQFDFWLMDMCFLNSIAACKVLNREQWSKLNELFELVLRSFSNPNVHEKLREVTKEWRVQYADCLLLGHNVSKSMIAYIVCHEIAHIVLGHLEEDGPNPEFEFEADKLAFSYYGRLVNHPDQSQYLSLGKQFLSSPILLFNYFSQIEKYLYVKTGSKPVRKTHPNPIERAKRLGENSGVTENQAAMEFLDGFFKGLVDLIEPLNLPKTLDS